MPGLRRPFGLYLWYYSFGLFTKLFSAENHTQACKGIKHNMQQLSDLRTKNTALFEKFDILWRQL
jgi:hypothetical protein